ncbi:MAG: OsmC family protein [Geminicoccaceae bacterium]
MAHRFSTRLVWSGAAEGPAVTYEGYSREYRVEIDGKPPLKGSSAPVFRGDAGLHNPEDLLVAALSACHMLWYLHLCTDAGIHVSAYSDEADGRMDRRGDEIAFTEVVLRPKVTIIEGDAGKALALHRDANRKCFIANSVNFPVRHEPMIEGP